MVWTHIHSNYSAKDALPHPVDIVARAKQLRMPALGWTDHGNMGGTVQFYLACRKAGIEPLPGIEAYVAFERSREGKGRKRAETFHLTMLATNLTGYRNLVALNNQAHRQFYYQPVIDLGDLASAAESGGLDGVYGLSGCWFGLGPRMLREGSPMAVLGLLKALAGWFGSGFAIELMHHEISDDEHDDSEHVAFLHSVSERLGLPTVISQDSHYVYAQDRADHDFYKWLTSWGNPDEAQWPGKLGYHMVGFDEVKHLYPKHIWDKAMDGMLDLYQMAQVRIPELESYTLRVPDMALTRDPLLTMQGICDNALTDAVFHKKIARASSKRYWARLEDEYEVISSSGFAPYLMLVKEVCDELERRGIVWSVRGSASGSLVCWLLGITTFDPIRWRLRFDRFLSTDRTKPPDIDIDMDPEFREEMFDHLGSRFHTLRIGTWSKYGLTTEDADDFDPDRPQRGSLPVQYKYAVGKIIEARHGPDRKRWPREAHDQWNAEITPAEWKRLRSLDRHRPYKNWSTHAAGLIITDDERTIAEIPQLAVTGKGYMVSAFDKDDVERLGLVKLDLLNLKLLTAIRVMQQVSGVRHQDVPPNDAKVFTHLNRGNVTGVFQLEGGSTRTGLRRLQPKKVEDLVAAVALFRPATMNSGATDDFLRRRNKEASVPVRHSLIEAVTKETYGILLYQEQAIEIFRSLGMSIEEIEAARGAIKASNSGIHSAGAVLDELMLRVRSLGVDQGLSDMDITWLESTLAAFSGYAFNRAHAVAYAVWAYKSAWYALHHPVAFWTGMLTAHSGNSEKERIKDYIVAAVGAGVVIRQPNVRISGVTYRADTRAQAIYKGLQSIDGIGIKTAEEIVRNQPYTSLDDLATRVSNRLVSGSKNLALGVHPADCTGAVALLHNAGALKGLAFE
jgi:DNA polymerase III subunit alpha